MPSKNENTPLESLFLYTLHVIGWFWNKFSFVPWYVLSRNFQKLKHGRIQGISINGNPAGPYRNISSQHKLLSSFMGYDTVDKMFREAVKKHGEKICLGTRELLSEEDEVQPNGRVFKKVILGDYQWLNFNQVYEYVTRISAGIAALGVKPKENISIFAETKAEWMLAAQACFMRNFSVVTIYATLGDEALVYGFNQVESRVIFTDAALLPKILKILSKLNYVTTIVYFGDAKKSLIAEFPNKVKVYSLQEIENYGGKLKNMNAPIVAAQPDDTAVIMYTSGSTGLPKGVILSHKNLVSTIAGLFADIPELKSDEDRYIAYLPLAHILELMSECALMSIGVPIAYSTALTLTDQSSKIKKGSKGDISVARPTLLCSVPMILDRIKKVVTDKVNKGPLLARLLFKFAYDYKLKLVRQGYDTPILNRLIFKKIGASFGGQVRMMVCGGAPLSPETEEFIRVCFCCPVSQGYGLTETCAGGTVKKEWDQSTGRVGTSIPSSEIKLVDWEEGGYKSTDKPHPRGELVIGGNNVALGYLKMPEATAENFRTEDGQRWFYTGDIGEIHSDGVIKIIDRKKDLVKLAHGEYVSLGKVETVLKHSQYVDNCCAYGDGQATYTILLVVPHQQNIVALAEQLGVDGTFEQHCSNKQVVDAVLKDIQQEAKKGGLHKTETPLKLVLCKEVWLPETELVTAAFKLKRKQISQFYQKDIERLYLN